MIGLIIAAGKQTRFKSEIPKALQKLNNEETILDHNINVLNQVCNTVYVVNSFYNKKWFKSYNQITINSGLGSGHAIGEAIKTLKTDLNESVIIIWGDSIQDKDLCEEMIKHYKSNYCDKDVEMLVPTEKINNPYTHFEVDNRDYIQKVLFKKYEAVPDFGNHDLSIFLIPNIGKLCKYINEYNNKFFRVNKYTNKDNGEFEFLDLFNYTKINGQIYESGCKSQSFNTIDEYNKLISEV